MPSTLQTWIMGSWIRRTSVSTASNAKYSPNKWMYLQDIHRKRFNGVKCQVLSKPVNFQYQQWQYFPSLLTFPFCPYYAKGSIFILFKKYILSLIILHVFSIIFQFQVQFRLQFKKPTRQLATSLNRSTRPIFNARPWRKMPSTFKTLIALKCLQWWTDGFHGVKCQVLSKQKS